MTALRRSILATLSLGAASVALAACVAAPAATPTTPPPASASSAPPVASPEPSVSATSDAEATCASLLPASTVADFEELGWTSQEGPFYAGGVELADGIQCTWGDYSVATDHVQIYGWAPITDAAASTAKNELLSGGWRSEESADGLYITESTDTAIATDDEGYGITYLFGDGWVTISDTKQGLLLIERPAS